MSIIRVCLLLPVVRCERTGSLLRKKHRDATELSVGSVLADVRSLTDTGIHRPAAAQTSRQDRHPGPLAGIAISADGATVIAVDDEQPTLFLIDTEAGKVREEVPLKDVPKPAQIARYAPDFSLLAVTSVRSDTVSLIDPSFVGQTAIKVGSQPMDMAFRGDELFVGCQGDGSVHVIDIPGKRHKTSFSAGTGCESLGFF